MSADGSRQRPYKVWSSDRTIRKGITASNYQELVNKGKVKLALQDSDVSVVLESDGTEIDDDRYFHTLEDNTVFVFLRTGERWYPPGVEAIRAAIHAIPRIVCDAINTLELIDEAPSWKIMDNRGRITVVLNWDQREIRKVTVGQAGRSPTIKEVHRMFPDDGSMERKSPIMITAKIESVDVDDTLHERPGKKVTTINDVSPTPGPAGRVQPIIVEHKERGSSPDGNMVCDFHCCALHEEGGRIHVNKSVATSPIQEQPEITTRRPSPRGTHVRFLDVHMERRGPDRENSSESDTENTAADEEQLSERYLLLVDQLSVEQKHHLTIKDIGIILERLSSKIIDVERLEREKESEDVHNWTIKATIKGLGDDETDGASIDTALSLLMDLHQNAVNIHSLTNNEIESVINMNLDSNQQTWKEDFKRIQEACSRILLDRQNVKESLELLDLLQEASTTSKDFDVPKTKRRRRN